MNARIRALLAGLILAASSLMQAADAPAIKPPPPAQLFYKARADVRGIVLDGES